MAILRKISIDGKVSSLLINRDRSEDLSSAHESKVEVDFSGFVGEAHSGLTRKSCSRVRAQYPRGTEIRNVRQISILSAEELAEIAVLMGIPILKPEWIGANLILAGIPHLTMLPPSTRGPPRRRRRATRRVCPLQSPRP